MEPQRNVLFILQIEDEIGEFLVKKKKKKKKKQKKKKKK